MSKAQGEFRHPWAFDICLFYIRPCIFFSYRVPVPARTLQPRCRHGVLSRSQQNHLRRSRRDQSARIPPLQPRRDRRRQADEGAPALLRSLTGTPSAALGSDPVRSRHDATALGRRHRLRRERDQTRPRRLRVHGEARRPLLLLPRPRRGPRRQEPQRKPTPISTASSRCCKEEQQRTGIKLLWGTANLFSNPRFVHGAATSPNADVFAYAAAQVKKCLEVTRELGGVNYVFWGGREGYFNLYNTDMKRELDHLARFFHLAVEYKKKIGFTGQFLIEPKPKEPTNAPVRFRRRRRASPSCAPTGWTEHFKLNVETNHATLAGHTMMHELAYASLHGMLGSIDANRGDLLLGWDTDQFPTDYYLTTQCMLVILGQGGLTPGGVNFDAKVRRESFEPIDLFHAHIGGMDAFAPGLKIAAKIRADGVLKRFRQAALCARGTRASASRSRRGRRNLRSWKSTCSRRATRRRTVAGGRRCWRISSIGICARPAGARRAKSPSSTRSRGRSSRRRTRSSARRFPANWRWRRDRAGPAEFRGEMRSHTKRVTRCFRPPLSVGVREGLPLRRAVGPPGRRSAS